MFWAIVLPTFGVQEGPLGRLLEAAVGLPRKTSGLGLEDPVGLSGDFSSQTLKPKIQIYTYTDIYI